MRYMLDTNVWIRYLKNPATVAQRLRRTPVHEIVVCSVVWAELLHGARKYGQTARRVALIEQTLAPYRSLPFDDAAAREYARIRHALEIEGSRIGANDLLIASIAAAHGVVVVTNDQAFQRVPGLRTEDWLIPVS